MIMKWLSDNARWVLSALIIIVLTIMLLSLTQCDRDNKEAVQAQQTTRSTEAVASAAANAVAALEDRTITERAIDDAVQTATKEINDAQSTEEVYAAVKSALCGRAAYVNDPACRVR